MDSQHINVWVGDQRFRNFSGGYIRASSNLHHADLDHYKVNIVITHVELVGYCCQGSNEVS